MADGAAIPGTRTALAARLTELGAPRTVTTSTARTMTTPSSWISAQRAGWCSTPNVDEAQRSRCTAPRRKPAGISLSAALEMITSSSPSLPDHRQRVRPTRPSIHGWPDEERAARPYPPGTGSATTCHGSPVRCGADTSSGQPLSACSIEPRRAAHARPEFRRGSLCQAERSTVSFAPSGLASAGGRSSRIERQRAWADGWTPGATTTNCWPT